MNVMPDLKPPGRPDRRAAVLVLVIALAATCCGVWREGELARRGQIIRWQDGLAQLQTVLAPAFGQQFEDLRNQARRTLRDGHYSAAAWADFLAATPWRQRFPGMVEVGYAEYTDSTCPVRFVSATMVPPPHPPGFDLNRYPLIQTLIKKTGDAGYGMATPEFTLGDGTNTERVVMGMLPLLKRDVRPESAAETRANLDGFIFFALDQRAFFTAFQPQLQNMSLNLRLLGADEPAPSRSATQRYFANGGVSGEWRFVATMKPAPLSDRLPQMIVLAGGLTLGFLLYWLFATQARLRLQAELTNAIVLRREVEITALNRDLEEKIAGRTAELKEALAHEKELNRLKGNFVSMVTHEIRTPLALILSSSQILSRYLDRLAPVKRVEHLQTIAAAVSRMNALMEDVLTFSKAEAGRMTFNPVLLDLSSFFARLVDEALSATNRRCPVELAVNGCPAARGDENLLRHIFANLLSNAVKYSPPGVPVIFAVSRHEGDAVFLVQDHGQGIPAGDREHLLTPFYRGKNVATTPGTGLGLVIVRHCVERHGGSLTVESAENAGTTVRVRLPLFSPAHTAFIHRQSQLENS